MVETVKIGDKTLIPDTDYNADEMTKVTGEDYKWTVNNDMTTVDIPVLKTWANNTPYADAVRFEVQTSTGDKVTEDAYGDTITNPVVLNADNSWTSTFAKLPKLDANGDAITYQVVETGVCFGDTAVEANWKTPGEYFTVGTPEAYQSTGFSITNTPKTTTVKVDKQWFQATDTEKVSPLNIQNAEITVKLTDGTSDVTADASGTAIASVTLDGTETTPWTYEWTNLPVYNTSGEKISYSVVETSAKVEKEGEADGVELITDPVNATAAADPAKPNEFHLVNTLPTITVSGTKTWVDKKETHDNPTLTLTRTVEGGASETVNVQPVWTTDNVTGKPVYTYADLPKYSDQGELYTYAVDETVPEGYSMTSADNETNGKDFVNTEITRVSVTKVWKLNGIEVDNPDDVVESITVDLKRTAGNEVKFIGWHNLEDYSAATEEGYVPVTITRTPKEGGGYEWPKVTIENLPKYYLDDSGAVQSYTYHFVERDVTGWSATYKKQGSADDPLPTGSSVTIDGGESIITNSKFTVSLPATGGMGTGVVYGAGAALLLLAVLGLILLNRKRTDGEGIR